MGCIAIIVQILTLFAFYYYYISPKIGTLEKTIVEKNLHRGLELIQRELFHLTHISQLLAEDPLMEQLINTKSLQLAPNDVLQRKMVRQEINLIYVVNNDHKVIWEDIIDLSAERPYPKQPFLTSLWEKNPSFLDHNSSLSLKAGIFNSSLGPMLVVSCPITLVKNTDVQGTLIIGRLINQDVIHLIQSLSYTDVKLWPLGGATLNVSQRMIIQKLLQGDSDFTIEQSGDVLRGYMYLEDLNMQPSLLISTTQPREITKTIELGITEIGTIFIVLQILFLITIFFLIRSTLLVPARQLIQQINQPRKDWRPVQVDTKPWNEMGILATGISNLISRHQDRLTQETIMAYRDGCYQTRHHLFQEIEDTLKPVIDGIELTEKKLSNLPTNDLEWIIAESKTGQVSLERLAEYSEKLQNINEKLRHYQKETRHRLYDLYTRTLRNAAAIRAQSRSLDTIREFTPIGLKDQKEKPQTSRS